MQFLICKRNSIISLWTYIFIETYFAVALIRRRTSRISSWPWNNAKQKKWHEKYEHWSMLNCSQLTTSMKLWKKLYSHVWHRQRRFIEYLQNYWYKGYFLHIHDALTGEWSLPKLLTFWVPLSWPMISDCNIGVALTFTSVATKGFRFR